MRQSIVSKVLGVIILYISLVLLPIFFISIVDWRDDSNRIQVASRNFVDKTIDAGQITRDMVEDLNLSLAACNGSFTYSISRETKVTNPIYDVNGNVTGYETTWQYAEFDNDTMWLTGDIITVTIEQNGFSLFQRLAMGLVGVSYNKQECVLSGMVR